MNLYASTLKGILESKAARRRERQQHAAVPRTHRRKRSRAGFLQHRFSIFTNH